MSARFRTIVADPPWPITKRMGAGGRRRQATEVPYDFMSLDEIKALPIGDLADDECHLYLWATRRLFREGEAAAVARAWGFEPKGEIIWGLRNPGMGGFLGNGHEPVLLASRGGGFLATEPASRRRRVLATGLSPRQATLGQARRVPRPRGAALTCATPRTVCTASAVRLGVRRQRVPSDGASCRGGAMKAGA